MKKPTTPTCPPKTAVAYARYSSAGQRDVSIEQQLADIRAFAKREGYTLVHEYADHARSGFKNTSARTAFQSMMAAAESGTFDTVLAWKVDRFGRNREDSAIYKGKRAASASGSSTPWSRSRRAPPVFSGRECWRPPRSGTPASSPKTSPAA